MKRLAAVVCLVVVTAVPALGQGKTDPTLDKLAKEFAEAFNAKNAAKVAAFYAEDAVLMPPNVPMVKGRTAIETFYKQGFSQALGKITLRPMESAITGSRGFEAGVSTLTTGSASETAPGKYVVIYKRVGNEWKIAFDMFNDDAPSAVK
jgi:uncharacterized protein (TIGR02246 family)